MKSSLFILLLGLSSCVSQREYDVLRDRESSYATKTDVSSLVLRIEGEEKADVNLVSRADLDVVKNQISNVSENVTKNTVGRQEFGALNTDVQENKNQITVLNAGISILKSVFGGASVLLTLVLGIIGTLTALGYMRSRPKGQT